MKRPLLHLPAAIWQAMLEQARKEAPNECLGLLFGRENRVFRRVPLENVAAMPRRRYEAKAEALLKALQEADSKDEALLAIYHSHPKGPQTPSPADLEEARYRALMLIIVPERNIVRAFEVSQEGARECDIVVERLALIQR